MKTTIDPSVLGHRFGAQILAVLHELPVNVSVESQLVAGTIHWQRTVQQELIGINGEVNYAGTS